ncbi:MAG: DUF1444 family protein [Planctomycetaceae bacterium]
MTSAHPDHWSSYTGPTNWYQFLHPPSWKIDDREGAIRLSAPEEQGVLNLTCFWQGEGGSGAVDASMNFAELLIGHQKVRRVTPPDFPYRTVCLEGESTEKPPGNWWQRLWRRRIRKHWRVWMVRYKSLSLIAHYQHQEGTDLELESIAAMIVRSLTFAEDPADPPHVFAERVISLARHRFPLLDCRRVDEFRLQLGESSVNLFNFYRSYVNDPHRFEEIVLPALTTVVQVQEWGTDQTEPPFESVRNRILPMLYPESVWRQNFPNFIAAPWIADLMILYVVDETQAYWYIREDLLEKWSLDIDELHEIALENLDHYFQEHEMPFTLAGEEEGPKLLMPNRPDAYNSARLLSESFHGKLREHLGSPLAVGIPSRDFLVAVSLDSDDTIDQVRRKVADDFARMDHPLTCRLLLVSPDGVSEFCEN